MRNPDLELAVFDLAGTTIDDGDVVAHALAAAVDAIGVPVTYREANSVMGLPKPAAIAALLATAGRHPDEEAVDEEELVRRATALFEQTMLDHYRDPGAVVPIRGAVETFEELRRRGVKIAIDTGFSAAVADAILDTLGWLEDGLVDARVASDEVERGRPAPDLIFEAMRRCVVTDVRAVAKVGDTPADLGEGANAGCGWNIGVTYGTHSREELSKHPHTALVDDLRDLPLLLGEKRSRSGTRLISVAQWVQISKR
jgi:phosphonatase-like hydrolase